MLFTVFYMRPEYFRDLSFGNPMPAIERIGVTHAELRTIEAASCEDVFRIQQAHNWAEDYKATNALLKSKGLSHTSMSVGDVIRNDNTGEYFAVANAGFKLLNPEAISEMFPFRVTVNGKPIALLGDLESADNFAEVYCGDNSPENVAVETSRATMICYTNGPEGLEWRNPNGELMTSEEFINLITATKNQE